LVQLINFDVINIMIYLYDNDISNYKRKCCTRHMQTHTGLMWISGKRRPEGIGSLGTKVPVGSRGEAQPVEVWTLGHNISWSIFYWNILPYFSHSTIGSQNQRGAKGVYGSHGRTKPGGQKGQGEPARLWYRPIVEKENTFIKLLLLESYQRGWEVTMEVASAESAPCIQHKALGLPAVQKLQVDIRQYFKRLRYSFVGLTSKTKRSQ